MSLLKKLLIGLVIIAALCAAALVLLPWQGWLEKELKAELAARGLGNVVFEVGSIGTSGVTLNNISLGNGSPVKLESVSLGYAISDLLSGKVQELRVGALAFRHGDIQVTLDGLDAQIDSDNKASGMHGTWVLHNIRITGLPIPLPVMQGSGQFSLDKVFAFKGRVQSADALHNIMFGLDYPLEEPQKAVFTIAGAQLPWNGGIVRIGNMQTDVYGDEPVSVPVLIERVSLNALLQQAAGEGANATGAISGQVPVIIKRDGTILVNEGNLRTDDRGTLSLPPTVIPGSHPQVDMVRDILQNFHYSDINLTLQSDKPKKLSMLLSLKGNNPEVYNGRVVNLNVNLTGDLLDLLQQGMITIVDPKQLLRQDAK